jgi:hypothetical protein
MSDGPHKSLPMRRGWRRVAEYADNQTFDSEEVAMAVIHAVKQDCQADLSPEYISSLRAVFRVSENLLFKRDVQPELEALRGQAGSGMGSTLLELAIQKSAIEEPTPKSLERVLTDALTDRVARCARQVEEHYLRESAQPRANTVRGRIERASNRPAIENLARQILKPDGDGSSLPTLKRQGLDDGVKF